MSFRSVFFAGLLAAGLFGCGKQPEPRHIVILIDVSGSIDRQALDQAFKAIDGMVGHLHRGDRIAIIPILGDAEAEASGRIIRFQVPTNRQAYDSDLHKFRLGLGSSLKEMQAEAVAHPGSKTDILQTIVLAQQEFASIPDQSKRYFVILSDFIQEGADINFRADANMNTNAAADRFAVQMARDHINEFKSISVYLGLLKSREYGHLGRKRREAIMEFWIRYFRISGTEKSEVMFDGPGMLNHSMHLD